MDTIRVIERSLRAWVCGLIGLIPVLGVPLAVLAVSLFFKVRAEAGDEWNPAENYLRWAVVCAVLGLGLTFLLVLVIVLALAFG
ncbi:MAG: hypothetical protein HYY24_16130 [Verrucomicrobia bacterium]|nr:hypothetical protein [Verrucomicrobiota bacterium]